MSSLFGQVWFWSLLAFLVGALMTSLLLVRPLSKRVKELETHERHEPHEPGLLADDAEWEKADAEIQSWSESEQDTATIDKPVADFHDDPDWLESDSIDAGHTPTTDLASSEDPDEFFRRDDETAKTQEELQGDFTAEDFASPSEPHADDHADADADADAGSHGDADAGADSESGSGAVAAAGAAGLGAAAVGAGAAASKSSDDEEDKPAADTDVDGEDTGRAEEHQTSGSVDAATEITPAAGELPQRRKRGAGKILGGFGTPKPIKPSLRKTKRRDAAPAAQAADGAALFEAKDEHQENGHVPDEVEQNLSDHDTDAQPDHDKRPAAEADSAHPDDVPAGPFGAGSAMPLPGGEAPSSSFKVKGSVTALRYCTADSSQFDRMVAEVWFASVDDAERVGFRAL